MDVITKPVAGRERGAAIELEDGFVVSWERRGAPRSGQRRVRRFLQGSGRKVDREGFRGLGPATVFVTRERFYFFRSFLESCDVDFVAWPACLGPSMPS